MNSNSKNPIFIFGYPRSGTTLLRSVLSQHSNISLVNEPELIFALHASGYNLKSPIHVDGATIIRNLSQINLCKWHLEGLPKATLVEFMNSKPPFSFKEIYEKLLPRPSDRGIIWGEKSLNNLFFIKEINQMYQNALFIHIVRDPRAVILSKYRKTRGEIDQNNWQESVLFFSIHALRWNIWMQIAVFSAKLLPSNSWLQIKYEEFLNTPRETLKRIVNAIGVSFEEVMLSAEARRTDPVLSSKRAASAHQKLVQDFDKSRINTYEILPSPLIFVVERHAKRMMMHFGYSPINPNCSTKERIFVEKILSKNRKKMNLVIKEHLKWRRIGVILGG